MAADMSGSAWILATRGWKAAGKEGVVISLSTPLNYKTVFKYTHKHLVRDRMSVAALGVQRCWVTQPRHHPNRLTRYENVYP
jgi:hypothetical protein